MIILITNDDGIDSPGIKSLTSYFNKLGELWVVAPDRERNAIGRALTLHRPLRVQNKTARRFAVNGTPSDCVNLAINRLLPEKPKLVVSGINKGGNLGDDISYSGTISAAFEATILGIPAFAISLATRKNFKFRPAALFAARLAKVILKQGLPPDTFLNVNVPDTDGREISSYKITRQGKSIYDNAIVEKVDPRGGKYYWLGGTDIKCKKISGSDFEAVSKGFVSITPLKTDHTNYSAIKLLKSWEL
jgi:5'-nucleotidase